MTAQTSQPLHPISLLNHPRRQNALFGLPFRSAGGGDSVANRRVQCEAYGAGYDPSEARASLRSVPPQR